MLYQFTTTAHHDGKGWNDTVEEFIFAYSYDHAKHHITSRLQTAGWTIDSMEGHQVPFEDIRDMCDRITF